MILRLGFNYRKEINEIFSTTMKMCMTLMTMNNDLGRENISRSSIINQQDLCVIRFYIPLNYKLLCAVVLWLAILCFKMLRKQTRLEHEKVFFEKGLGDGFHVEKGRGKE